MTHRMPRPICPTAVADGRSTEIARTRETERACPYGGTVDGVRRRRFRLCCGFMAFITLKCS